MIIQNLITYSKILSKRLPPTSEVLQFFLNLAVFGRSLVADILTRLALDVDAIKPA